MFNVVPICLCPNRSDTVLTSTLFAISHVALVCLNP